MFPRWLSLLFLVVLAVMLVQTGRGLRQNTNKNPAVVQEHSYPEISKFTDAEQWKKSINPDYAKLMEACAPVARAGTLGVKVSIDKLGEGSALGCAEKADFTLTKWDSKGHKAGETTLLLTLGQTGVIGLDAALLDMKQGAMRTVIIPAASVKADSPLHAFVPAGQLVVITFERVGPKI